MWWIPICWHSATAWIPWRFFLLRTFPFGSDGNFTNELLIQTINADLANSLGNLVSRNCGATVEKYFGGTLIEEREAQPIDQELIEMAVSLRGRYQEQMDKYAFQNGLGEIFEVLSRANKYIDETTPWVAGEGREQQAASGVRDVQSSGDHPYLRVAAEALYSGFCLIKILGQIGASA